MTGGLTTLVMSGTKDQFKAMPQFKYPDYK
jgi:hypothetical protein